MEEIAKATGNMDGLTKREYAAIHIAAGIFNHGGHEFDPYLAANAVKQADALMEALSSPAGSEGPQI